MPALALLIVPHKHAHWITCSPTALSCGRSKYSIPFQLDCVPRKVFQSNSTSRPSAWKKPSSSATKSLRPIPFGATLIFMLSEYIARGEKHKDTKPRIPGIDLWCYPRYPRHLL